MVEFQCRPAPCYALESRSPWQLPAVRSDRFSAGFRLAAERYACVHTKGVSAGDFTHPGNSAVAQKSASPAPPFRPRGVRCARGTQRRDLRTVMVRRGSFPVRTWAPERCIRGSIQYRRRWLRRMRGRRDRRGAQGGSHHPGCRARIPRPRQGRALPLTVDVTLRSVTEHAVRGFYTSHGSPYGNFPFEVHGAIAHGLFRPSTQMLNFDAMLLVMQRSRSRAPQKGPVPVTIAFPDEAVRIENVADPPCFALCLISSSRAPLWDAAHPSLEANCRSGAVRHQCG